MKYRLLAVSVMALICWSWCGTIVVAGQMRIVHSIRFPAHVLFGGDIAWDGQYIWSAFYEVGDKIAGDGDVGPEIPCVRSLDPVDGSAGPFFQFGQGLDDRSGIVWDGNHLWVTRTGGLSGPIAQTVPDYIYEFEPDGTEVGFFELPGSPDIAANGLAFDGTHLWVSDSRHQQILQVDPQDMSVVKSIHSPGSTPLGLVWHGSSLFTVDGVTDEIYELDTSGNVLESWSTPLVAPFGITYDGDHFWVLDNATRTIYQLEEVPEPSVLALLAVVGPAVLLSAQYARRVARAPGREFPSSIQETHT